MHSMSPGGVSKLDSRFRLLLLAERQARRLRLQTRSRIKAGALGCRPFVGNVWPTAWQVTDLMIAEQAIPLNKGRLKLCVAAFGDNTDVSCL